jgi:hypothetical protein
MKENIDPDSFLIKIMKHERLRLEELQKQLADEVILPFLQELVNKGVIPGPINNVTVDWD